MTKPKLKTCQVTKRYAQAVKHLMDQLNYSQTQIAPYLGIKQQYLSRIIRGERKVNHNLILAAQEKFKVNPSYLFGQSNNMFH